MERIQRWGGFTMPHKIVDLLAGFPFVLALTEGSSRRIKMNWTRIIEGILIAGATAMLTAYVSIKEMRVEVANIKCTLDEHKASIKSVDDRLYAHVIQTRSTRN